MRIMPMDWRASWDQKILDVGPGAPSDIRRAKALNAFLVTTVAFVGGLTLINLARLFITPSTPNGFYLVGDVVIGLGLLGLLWLNQTRYRYWASLVYLVGAVLAVSIMFPFEELDTVLSLYTFPIAVASFVAAPATSFYVALVAFSGYSIVWAQTGAGSEYNDVSMLGLFALAFAAWLVASFLERTLKRIQESESRFQTLIESVGEGIGQVEEGGQFVFANPALEEIFGLPAGAMAGRNVNEFVAPTQRLDLERQAARQRQGMKGASDLEIIRGDGAHRFLHITATPWYDGDGNYAGAFGAFRDVTEMKRAALENAHLFIAEQTRREELSALYGLARGLADTDSFDRIVQLIVRHAVETVHVTFAQLVLFEGDALVLRAAFPIRAVTFDLSVGNRLSAQTQVFCRQVLRQRKVVVINPMTADLEAAVRAELFVTRLNSMCLVPIRLGDQDLGLILFAEARSETREPFDADKIRLVRAIGDQAAGAIHRAHLHEQTKRQATELAQAYQATIEGWSRALDLRDNETEGHSLRVTAMTERLARQFGFDEDALAHIRRGALLHDIGKMGIPDSILLKQDVLTESEWDIMRLHPGYAYELLSRVEYLRPALDIPYCHHENWDGSGYPRGLKGEAIPLVARIFAVVDVWDALCSDRPYRSAWPLSQVCDYIRSLAGVQFDSQVVDAFLPMLIQP